MGTISLTKTRWQQALAAIGMLAVVYCVAVVDASAQQSSKQYASAAQIQTVNKFAAPLKIRIPREWEYYFADGIGRLDGTGISIIQKYMVDIFAVLEENAREPYMLLIAEHFRNDYRQHKKMPVENIVEQSVPAALPYVESAKSAFENMRQEIIDTYLLQIEEMQRRQGSGGRSPVRTASGGTTTNSSSTAAKNSAIRGSGPGREQKQFATINERATTIDSKLSGIEQNLAQYNQRLTVLEAQQPRRSREVRQAWVAKVPAGTPAARTNNNDSRKVQQIARATDQRLTAIEQRETRIEQEIVKIDSKIERIESVSGSTQPAYVHHETPAPKVVHQSAPAHKPAIISSATTKSTSTVPPPVYTASAAPTKASAVINTYQPQNNTVDGQCSMESCTAIEDWLMKWYAQYVQYSEDKKRSSKFLTALRETKDIYDRQKQTYPKKVKFLLKRFDMIPYDM